MIQTNNIDKQEKKFKETIIKTYKMDSIDTQDFIDKTLAEIKLSGILDNSHEITIFTSYFRPAYTCFSYITNDKGNDFFIPYLPTTQISGGILSEYSFARMLLGEEDTYNLIEELCNRIAQSKHINVKNIYNPYALPYIWSDELFTPSAAYLYSRPEENIKVCKQWQTLYKEKYAKQKEKSRGTYSDKSGYYDYLDFLFKENYPNSHIIEELEKVKLYEKIGLKHSHAHYTLEDLDDKDKSKQYELLACKYYKLAQITYDDIQKNNIKTSDELNTYNNSRASLGPTNRYLGLISINQIERTNLKKQTLLQHLLHYGYNPQKYLDKLDYLDTSIKAKEYLKKHTDEESKEIEYIDHDIQKWKKQLKDIRKGWKHSKRKHNMDEEIELIKEFVKQKETR